MRSSLLAALAVLLACSASAVSTAVAGPHVLRAPQYWPTARPATGIVDYWGGPVVSRVEIVSVLWGPDVDQTTVSGVPEYVTALANSNYVDQLSIYDTFLKGVNGHKGTRQHIYRGTFAGQIEITPKHKSANITDSDIVKELRYQIEIGVLPPQTPDMWYAIYFPSGISIFLPGYGYSCTDWDAYHWSSNHSKIVKNNIYYAVEPSCGGFDFITWTTSHEFAETLTDPQPPDRSAFPAAWITPNYAEIGYLCEGYYGYLSDGTNTYLVQQEYLNTLAGCSTGNYTSP